MVSLIIAVVLQVYNLMYIILTITKMLLSKVVNWLLSYYVVFRIDVIEEHHYSSQNFDLFLHELVLH